MAIQDQSKSSKELAKKPAKRAARRPSSIPVEEEAAKKKNVDSKKASGKKSKLQMLSADDRHRLIQEKAYFISEQNGFQDCMALDAWLLAEKEVESLLSEIP